MAVSSKSFRSRTELSAASLRAIAGMAGVSAMTVSRVLNDRGNVAAATRERVLRAARRLKYRPNRLAKAVLRGRSGTVGVMISPLKPFQSRVVHGIHDALVARGCLPILHFHDAGPEADRDSAELDYIHRLIDQRVDGLIFWPSDETVSDVYLEEVWQRKVPLVAVDRHLPQTRADFSGTDDEAGGRMAAEHLLSLGHNRLAHVGGEPWVSTYADRRKGFEQAVAAHGEPVHTVGSTQCECLDAVRALLASRTRPTALFAASDLMAPGIYAAAEAEGLVVGRDLAVVGFADLDEARGIVPGLTTLRQNPYEIGRQAARLVMDRIEGTAPVDRPQSVRLAPQLVVRESSGPGCSCLL
jgi:LacI family transcriptional regulator